MSSAAYVTCYSFRFAPGISNQVDDRGRLFPGRTTPRRGSVRAGYPQHIICWLCRGLSRATPAAVVKALQNLVVPVGTPFSNYLSEIKLLVHNARCIGHVALEDGTMQIAIETGMDDQFAKLSAQIFAGRNMRALPFDSVDDLMESLEDIALDQTRVTASIPLSGGVITRSKTYNKKFRSRQFGWVMSVEVNPFEDEAEEFGNVHAITREKGGFGKK